MSAPDSDRRDRETFAREGYVVWRAALAGPLLRFLWRYAIERADAGALKAIDRDVTAAAGAYGDPVMEHLLERLRLSVETLSGAALHPTYSYVRVYRRGDALAAHHDRPACEISLSLALGQEPAAPWPLWIRGRQGARAALLNPGDALLYRGIDCEHWRDPYDGERLAQVFLHYVDRAGPHAAWKFDKRVSLELSTPLPI